ncbi:MAG: RNA-binding S4 domain-containing protein [Candidatus Accumulibacter sp.]|uniref:RNA-binding S4 domain-containing protein n=2 Tax=Accumulibacter sp. TaxID=2053492 RepID=UPI0025F94132|nr:RNA-binding S4 domain-containing protein [Accumulibacter sp.]MCM8593816.1 RNA-binding S4 domain-containing protein [Accumulibacter sp.]MCM8626142.1 RNA-binding S4 domain-containing protein [Accumulibacter sp.]MDS4047957.1 RNA-binding S4 domain-containing protein [Accumulibacter sp.]
MMNDDDQGGQTSQRVDKWLWAARFYRTRSLAAEAIGAGHVRLGGQVVKASRELRLGDVVEINIGELAWCVVVRGFNEQRRPAPEARQLYRETDESSIRRSALREERRLAPTPGADLRGRPTKRARRLIRSFSDGP